MKQGPCSHIYKLERTLLTSKNNTCQALSIAQDEPSKNGSGSSNPTLKCSESGDAGDHHSGGIPGTLVGWGDDLVTDRGAWLLSNPHMQWDKQSLPTWALFTSRECLKQVCVSSIPQRDSLHGNNIRGVFLSFPEAKQKELHPLQFYETCQNGERRIREVEQLSCSHRAGWKSRDSRAYVRLLNNPALRT